MQRSVAEIRVVDRFRQDLGDIDGLAESIEKIGLLQPLVITPDNRLVAGARRLAAIRRLGWVRVPVIVAENLDDGLRLILAERDENEQRKGFTPSEAAKIAQALEPLERTAAKARQGERLDLRPSAKLAEGQIKNNPPLDVPKAAVPGKAVDKVAAAVGMGRTTLLKATEVTRAADEDPAIFAPIRDEMDRTGKVDPAFRQVRILQGALPPRTPSSGTMLMEQRDVVQDLIVSRPPKLQVQNAVEAMHSLAVNPLSGKAFREHALPTTLDRVRQHISGAIRFLEDVREAIG